VRPVDCQTADDCFSACLESVLEIPVGWAPKFGACSAGPDWLPEVARFLAPWEMVYIQLGWSTYLAQDILPLVGYHLLIGPHRETGRLHSVVALAGQIVHDPSPARSGLVDDRWKCEVGLFVEKNPAVRAFKFAEITS